MGFSRRSAGALIDIIMRNICHRLELALMTTIFNSSCDVSLRANLLAMKLRILTMRLTIEHIA